MVLKIKALKNTFVCTQSADEINFFAHVLVVCAGMDRVRKICTR
jgi:hypothetical protein